MRFSVVSGVTPCVSCGRVMRKNNDKAADFPGTVPHLGHGYCWKCRQTNGPSFRTEREKVARRRADDIAAYIPTPEQLSVLVLVRGRCTLPETREIAGMLGLLEPQVYGAGAVNDVRNLASRPQV